jgi:hypothetical protein
MTVDDIIVGFSARVKPFEMACRVVANIGLTALSTRV